MNEQWEYKTITINVSNFLGDLSARDAMTTELNEEGINGWQIINVETVSIYQNQRQIVAWLKRKISQ